MITGVPQTAIYLDLKFIWSKQGIKYALFQGFFQPKVMSNTFTAARQGCKSYFYLLKLHNISIMSF